MLPTENLKKILVDDEKFYQIPDYQRPYSWDKDNLSDLVDDLVNAYLSNQEENYFCGSLVLINEPQSERFDIIDGQQRTTTFTIIPTSKKLNLVAHGYCTKHGMWEGTPVEVVVS